MPDLEVVTEKVVVILYRVRCGKDLPEEVERELCHDSSSISAESYDKIYLKPGILPFSREEYVKVREWLAQRGIVWNGKDDDEYVLWEMC